ncbi:hypothetical protein GCM10025770_14790 [Viridibacterium curvum]|uniref:Uncharacterized protein n=1 Tax=Viridibacterium curvum TaxID=1101404 RepID=A0ABP9QJS3_9RHOO
MRRTTGIPILDLATTIVEFLMRREAIVVTKFQIVQRLREALVASELDDATAALVGRTISSLFAQKILTKIDTGH